jgi:hypothetical protein
MRRTALATASLIAAWVIATFAGDAPSVSDEISHLKKENAALKEENQRLRRLLAAQPESKPVRPGVGSAAPANGAPSVQPVAEAPAFWLSNTGKRHNPSCRYFQTAAGKPCGPNDGVPCKICGG